MEGSNRISTLLMAGAVASMAVSSVSEAAVLTPNKVVVVILQDRASDALTTYADQWDYLNSVASDGLVYSNSHGVSHPSLLNTVALYSGSTQGLTPADVNTPGTGENGSHWSFDGPNLAKSLFDAGHTFSGYVESLPGNGSQEQTGSDVWNGELYEDAYTRNINPMAQFTDIGIDPNTSMPRPNSVVNRTFNDFPADFSELPTVSYVIPNNLHNAHGSNEEEPWAGSSDEIANNILRNSADDWLEANLDAYLQWAKENNSLLIITQDEERWAGGTSDTVTTVINGDSDLFVAGVNDTYINHYDLLKTLLDMYGAGELNNTATANGLPINGAGQLVPEPGSVALLASAGLMLIRRRQRHGSFA